jgi:hypothetical protein
VANNLLTTSYIVNTGLMVLENELVFADKVNRQYSDEFAIKEAKIGATVNIRRPPRYIGTFGPALNVEDTNETYVPVSLTNQFHVDVQFTTADLLLSMDLFKTRVLHPMVAAVANRVDADTANYAYQNTAQMLGTPGVAPTSFKLFSDARAILALEGVPKNSNLCAILDPLSMSSMSDSLKGLFNPQASISENYKTGLVARKTAGLDWYEDQNIPSMTTGAQGGTPTLNSGPSGTALLTSGWAQTGFLQTTGWTASTAVVAVGDVIQIAGVYPVNPQSRVQYGRSLKQFVVLPPGGYANQVGTAVPGLLYAPATLTSGTFSTTTGLYTSGSGAGALSLLVKEVVISGGQFQNSSAAPATLAALTVNGGTANASKVSPQSIVMHRDAFALAFADLPLPRGVEEAARANDADIGMSIRMVTQYTVNNDAMPTRADVLYGNSSLYTNFAVRIAG